ncbi:hypothetical protein GGTG_05123 [Gaeumannomyces tritici R3-111a-1]|uniref:Uncharacterized protein n=1 Tax=Gaeumannomyces tritici (strain R3-111a-1) TaxID=644352 RepID=J3NV14_GAET3|nr:hypothetical protein GGTG_05123 [Gaeumannomyces tritici R3-111a-1]EJT75186.1 hypothetical protein GGTG_05123 [Gaeumannomyces tritici R3-111a-1]
MHTNLQTPQDGNAVRLRARQSPLYIGNARTPIFFPTQKDRRAESAGLRHSGTLDACGSIREVAGAGGRAVLDADQSTGSEQWIRAEGSWVVVILRGVCAAGCPVVSCKSGTRTSRPDDMTGRVGLSSSGQHQAAQSLGEDARVPGPGPDATLADRPSCTTGQGVGRGGDLRSRGEKRAQRIHNYVWHCIPPVPKPAQVWCQPRQKDEKELHMHKRLAEQNRTSAPAWPAPSTNPRQSMASGCHPLVCCWVCPRRDPRSSLPASALLLRARPESDFDPAKLPLRRPLAGPPLVPARTLGPSIHPSIRPGPRRPEDGEPPKRMPELTSLPPQHRITFAACICCCKPLHCPTTSILAS